MSVGLVVFIVGCGIVGGGIVIALGGLGHRFDRQPRLKRPFTTTGLSMVCLGIVLFIIGLVTR